MDWQTIIMQLCGLLAGGGIGWLTKSGRVKSRSDAYKVMAEGYEYRIAALHETVEKLNDAEKGHAVRIGELNKVIDDRTDRNRELSDRLYRSGTEINRVQDLLNEANARIIRLTEERDDESRQKEYYRMWRCERSDCGDPRGRMPPNASLATLVYTGPPRRSEIASGLQIELLKTEETK